MSALQKSSPLPASSRLIAQVGAPRLGEIIAETYTIKRMIARGGMGEIYLASTAHSGPDVVLKMLSERWLEQPDAVARFEREATRLRSVEHPNVVKMLGSGVDQGRPYLVMEFIDGEPLSEFLQRRGALTLREFVPIAAQILKGMGHAHLREMMLRDVKPSNIMLCTRKGRANFVKLLDFGLAKFTSNEPRLTEGHVLGTAGYLPPEAIRGEELDLRVDVYAIGVVFYQMLSGSLPFEHAESTTLLYKTLDEDPASLSEILPEGHDIPDALISLVSDCLQKDREQRPNDANIIVERLIDAVPSAYFRLPTLEQSPRSPGYGNSGLMELIRTNPSARFLPRESELVQIPPPNPVPEAGPKTSRTPRWSVVVGVAALVSLITTASVVLLGNGSAEPSREPAPLAPAAVAPAVPASGARERSALTAEAPSNLPGGHARAATSAESPDAPAAETRPVGTAARRKSSPNAVAKPVRSRSTRRRASGSRSVPVRSEAAPSTARPSTPPPADPTPEPASRTNREDRRRSVFLSDHRPDGREGRRAQGGLLPAR